jgi:GNAT superfamily N-acetyltransferase
VFPLGVAVDLDAITEWYGGRAHICTIPPGFEQLEPELERRRYERGYALMKFERGAAPAPAVRTDLRVARTLDPEPFAQVVVESGIPAEPAGALAALVHEPAWQCFVAWAGDEPAGTGLLYVDAREAWLGVAFTRPEFRGRGAQTALLAARIDGARVAGATTLTTETGERTDGRPDQSYRNIVRSGFREAYLRPNWCAGQ